MDSISSYAVIALLGVAFTATHIGLCTKAVRTRLVAGISEKGYLALYSIISLATSIPWIHVYASHVHEGPVLWSVTTPTRFAAIFLVLIGIMLLLHGVLGPAPSSMMKKTARKEEEIEIRGALRITRHPLSVGILFFGLAHLLVRGAATDIAFWGGLVLFCWLTAIHQDSRKANSSEAYKTFRSKTSFFPFVAILSGKQDLNEAFAELNQVALALGFAAYALLFAFHRSWFGVSPFH